MQNTEKPQQLSGKEDATWVQKHQYRAIVSLNSRVDSY